MIVEVLEKLITVADVHYIHCPSNHDYVSGFFLSDVIKTWFHKNENITFDCSIAHRKYFRYGTNLIGATHGDGAKQNDLPLLMAEETQKIGPKQSIDTYTLTTFTIRHRKTLEK